MPEVIAYLSNGRIRVRSPFAAASVAQSIAGGLWDKPKKEWHYPATATCADSIFKAYSQNNFDVRCDREFVELCARATHALSARDFKTRTDLPEIPGKLKPSWTHQRQAHHFAAQQDGALIAVGMGGGKSKIGTGLLDEWGVDDALILCPKSVVDVWPKELAKHSEREWIVVGHEVKGRGGKPKKNPSIKERVATIESELLKYRATNRPVAVVVNYEASWQGAMGDFLMSRDWGAIMLDESHRIKAPGGAASKFIARLRDKTTHRLALTGTPQPHTPLDIYSQARFLDPGIFGTNFARFRKRYAVLEDTYAAGGRIVQTIAKDENGKLMFQNEAELADKIAQFSFIIEQDELDQYLGLEEPVDVERYCVLTPKGQKAYDDVWNELATDIEGGVVTANNVLTRLLRVQQITSGHLPLDADTDEERVVVEIDDSKKRLLADVLEDIPADQPVVVFARFTHDLDQIRAAVEAGGRKYGELSGRDRGGMKSDATMSDEIDVLGVQMQAGGVGIDLTRAAHAIYYSIGFSLGDYLQSRKRVHRPGQTRHVSYTHLISKGTIDELVYAALAERKEVVDAVMKAAKDA